MLNKKQFVINFAIRVLNTFAALACATAIVSLVARECVCAQGCCHLSLMQSATIAAGILVISRLRTLLSWDGRTLSFEASVR